ncbi:30S ribosomal protein S1 [Listeria floridensis FSL S10-1187]|uniref:30S ribosomal protein S1 n=1 Tax=Listeria floridensis FSL S10-1187 TaxID=1265817 RepID=A0ABP3B0W0_9LIST|nr:30S ribosomal protein S1 [Listeria floridensis]EUJ32923.1 30S ribosomal protein S1 [Listeria floridensis FSL S10-1187]
MSDELNNVEVRNFEEGDKVTGTVTSVEDKQVYVGIPDSKLDGVVPISELSNVHVEKASDVVSVGDTLDLVVTKVEDDVLVLSKRKVDALKATDDIKAKFDSGEVFDAVVSDVVKGGLVVDLGVRAFVPASLVEDHFVEDFSDYKGKTLAFKVVEFEPEKNRVILSHRAIVEAEKEGKKKEILANIKEGDVLEGTVERLASFGAFVDLGGVDGLVHISQISYEHIATPGDVLSEGDKVNVKVIGVDPENERISLSIKETQPGPWDNISEKAQVGAVLKGKVMRLVTFGAFVEVFPGVEGLVHISQISHQHIGTPNEVLKEGQEVEVKVLDVNEDEKRLSLSIKALQEEPATEVDYELPEESTGFQMGDLIGDKLKNIQNDNDDK